MAGNPKKAALKAELERRTRCEFPDEPGMTWLDYACAWLVEGSMLGLARELKVSPQFLYKTLNDTFGKETVQSRMAEARALSAYVLDEEAIEIADDAGNLTPVKVQQANLRVRARQWSAERRNREAFGQLKATGTTVNIGTLMLQALQAPLPAKTATELDALARTRGSADQLATSTIQPATAIPAAIAEPAEILSVEPATTSDVDQ